MPNSNLPSTTSPGGVDTVSPKGPRGPLGGYGGFAVAGIGASAGGLEACTKLFAALAPGSGMAFILVQHLDPKHESLMVDLLSEHTTMPVLQAAGGMRLQPDHVYIIPPAAYLSVQGGVLRLSEPEARHGARLPIDFLFRSLAESYGPRAICVILSGTGMDGCLGLKAVKETCGLVIAQDPMEAGYAGMPRAAIATGAVDLVLRAAEIPAAIERYVRRIARVGVEPAEPEVCADWLPEIVALLRSKTAHDFTHYKPGTLQRRVERRMAMAAIDGDSMQRYLDLLRRNPAELELLARDLLINVTSFFRDPQVFDVMERRVIPELIRALKPDHALRIWVAGCSTGEETYSLAMLFREQLAAAQCPAKLQVFASDVDSDAVAAARDGFYPDSIAATVPPQRLARFFIREEHGYRIAPDLRACVVFTVQDVLADPPFSRLDLVSCRNLLIYLLPEAQARVISVFHFALREGGVLLLGSAETVGAATTRFEVISKKERIYRHVGRSRPGEYDFLQNAPEGTRLRPVNFLPAGQARQADLAELGKRLVLEAFAPAAVLINRAHECLFSLGPIDRFLRVPKGHSSFDLLAMVRPGLRSKLAAAIRLAVDRQAPVLAEGARMLGAAGSGTITLDVRPVQSAGEDLLLVCFRDDAQKPLAREQEPGPAVPRLAELEHELEATRADLKSVTQDLEASVEEQKAVTQEALSVNEEYQSTNEELLTSKEELQSLNEELTALNSQLQETLERQRKTADDLQNVLYSTDIATLFLDASLRIRFFTPATKMVFNVIPSDLGRPLADLHSLVPDCDFAGDAQLVLRSLTPLEREIETPEGLCFTRRIMPYRTSKDGAAGLVITFTDITERKAAARALEAAQRSSELANAAKSRFLAAASHDLRQPLQTLALLQALLAKSVSGDKQRMLVTRMGDTVGALSGMLNTLLDINQIDAGIIRPEITVFRIDEIFNRLREQMTYQAESQGLSFRVMPTSVTISSDQALLEQMIRNLISNAFKYTRHGKVLLGCRRFGETVRIEIWDTGIGIPERDLAAIFEEYRQLDNAARERSRGLGLGLPIVQRLGDLLGHKIRVRSRLGRGSVFSIEIACPPDRQAAHRAAAGAAARIAAPPRRRTGTILLIEDDPDIAELLGLFLEGEGHRVTTERDGADTLAHIDQAVLQPDLVLSDYNLPNGMSGLQLALAIRRKLRQDLPAIILTGDMSADILREVAQENCLHLSKPVELAALADAIQDALPTVRLLTRPPDSGEGPAGGEVPPTVFVIDDDEHVRNALVAVLEENGRVVSAYKDSETFLRAYRPGQLGCLVVDATLPGMSGLDLLRHLRLSGDALPAVMVTGNSDVPMAVQAMKSGADDFIEKPVGYQELLNAIDKALEHAMDDAKRTAWREGAAHHIANLTPRQRQIMDLVLAGHPSKNIAADLGISQRTVENHRASIMKRTGSQSLPALARLAVTAALSGAQPEAAA
jgi:two-component system CheB/CheR fusion protein